MIRITAQIAIGEDEIAESFVRASGPGGQHVNTTASAVELRFDARGSPNLPEDILLCGKQGLELDSMDTSYFIGKETLIAARHSDMAFWREKLFITMFRNADTVTNHFKLPPNRVVELGAQVIL